MKAFDLDTLRALLRPKILRERLSFSLVEDGIPAGAITELSGHGKTEAIVRFLKEHPEFRVAWIEKSFSFFTAALGAWGVDIQRFLFVESAADTLWVALQVLRAKAFHVVILYHNEFENEDLRKLQLAAEKAAGALIWLSAIAPENPWPIALRLKAHRSAADGQLEIMTLQRRMK
jgi:hypothetical protein